MKQTKVSKTLVLETALVKLAPVDVGSNVITSAVIAMPLSKGEVAIEGRLVDAASGKTVIRFTDARAGKDSLVNVKDFTKFSTPGLLLLSGPWNCAVSCN
ncbi:MAG: DUF3313 family protein [Candidatus Brocadiaceae bacterium]|nr:DUF3313 family protein [Candidatus Brocadiaceae bacterium]